MDRDNASIFFYGTPPGIEAIRALAEGAEVSSREEAGIPSITIRWPDVTLDINPNPAWDRAFQLPGIRGWIGQFSLRDRRPAAVKTLIAQLDRTSACYGAFIAPGFDKSGKAAGLLKALLGTEGGYLFTRQAFYSADGTRIIGMAGAPAAFGSP